MTDREAKFEAMLQAIQQEYHTTLEKMERLKAEVKPKLLPTASFWGIS